MLIYPTLGKACFVCEDEMKEVELLGKRPCSCCGGELPVQPQCLLEHVGAHILFDPMVDPALEPCGLCLRPGQCVFYLKKGKGGQNGQQINYKNSHCPSMV